ncbi:two-component system sensor histidine kinase ResE [Salsuginibacillus halophilus]|uniref:histidine kinase n=1 Tax=Salsuginibacillus halophilus TaxID=517424 RepID=A0A2P8HW59_9BACI|nr:ATP-binding protein [Salsuginibacillus halophilus]PSL50446.1 two-component system sensor histidine kinase ResE [Salsuginibacillus halophilus]
MFRFFRSVVGKLWMTILLLVSVVLVIVAVLLVQFFERFHITEAEEELTNHAELIVSVLEGYDHNAQGLATIQHIAASFDMKVVVFEEGEVFWESGTMDRSGVRLSTDTFTTEEDLAPVFAGESHAISRVSDEGANERDVLIVGANVDTASDVYGPVFVYQSLAHLEDTRSETKQIILLSAGIAIVLTTFFAFFLSTRITAPLRQMRQVTFEVAEGKFDTKVPILTRDEIGQLANAFNRMRRELNRHINMLNHEKEQLSRILSSMADGVITLDRKGSIVVTNPPADRFIEAYGFENGETESSEIPKDVRRLFQKVVAQEKEQALEFDVQGRSYAIVMTPLYDKDFVRGVVAVIRDMTEERQHDKLRKDFIANVSHELRTPISMLQGYSEAIIDDMAASEEERKELGRIIYDESQRMGRLVNELLDLARMEAGHNELNIEEIEVVPFLSRMERKFSNLAKEEGIHLTHEHDPEAPVMTADADRLEQVMTNLISNAFRHTAAGGSVNVKSEAVQEGVRLEVTDTGDGIPEEDLPFVFERFYKADKARTRGRSGTGLGLAIAKNIVEHHFGEITVHSKVGEGTTFRIQLPLAQAQHSLESEDEG